MAQPRPVVLSPQVESAGPPFLRMPTVMRMTGLGRSTIYRMVAENKFPRPVRLGARAVAWRRADLDRWSEARPVVTH
jgi:prophage regulatory protein